MLVYNVELTQHWVELDVVLRNKENKMYKPCNFNRKEYLENEEQFENMKVDDGQDELTEFNDDAECLAIELAYTRYALARAEMKIHELSA